MTCKYLLAAAALAAAAVATSALAAGADYLLKLDGVPGESKLESVDLSVLPRTGCSGQLAPGSLTISGEVPRAAAGAPIKKAIMFVRKAPGRGSELTIELENVMISSATPSNGPSTAGRTSAVVSLGKLGRLDHQGGSWRETGCTAR